MKVSLNCKEVSLLVSEGLDRDLPTADRARLRYHLVLCKTCRNVDEQFHFLRQAVRQLDYEPQRTDKK